MIKTLLHIISTLNQLPACICKAVLSSNRPNNQKHKVTLYLIFKFSNFQIISLILFLNFHSSHSQLLTPLSNELNLRVEYELYQSEAMPFTVFKPFYDTQLAGNTRQDSLDLFTSVKGTDRTWVKRKLFRESFVEVDSGTYYLFADPLLNLQVGQDNTGRKTMINTRGFRAGGRLGEYFAFGTEFYENQAVFPSWLDAQFHKMKVIPGQGRSRVKGDTWDFAHAEGYLSFSPWKRLNLQFGQGKNFIGDGYRSLLLSDAAYSYPYFKTTWLAPNFMYSWMLASLQNMGLKVNSATDEEPFKRETASIHLLSVNIKKRFQVTLVQCQLFNLPDTFGRMKVDMRLFNPLMLPLADTKNIHSLWGMNLKLKISRTLWLYNQWMFDNLLSNATLRTSVQAGCKYFHALGIKGLYLQGEFNRITPYTYTSAERPLQWMHFGESLAHPYGNNTTEFIAIARYNLRRWQLVNHLTVSRNTSPLIAYTDVIKPSVPYYVTGQKLLWNTTELNFFVNPKTLMHFSLGYTLRNESLNGNNKGSNVYFAFRTGLMNVYYDR